MTSLAEQTGAAAARATAERRAVAPLAERAAEAMQQHCPALGDDVELRVMCARVLTAQLAHCAFALLHPMMRATEARTQHLPGPVARAVLAAVEQIMTYEPTDREPVRDLLVGALTTPPPLENP